jgi:hypothetical protein
LESEISNNVHNITGLSHAAIIGLKGLIPKYRYPIQ